jgi:hypothetical protein
LRYAELGKQYGRKEGTKGKAENICGLFNVAFSVTQAI